MVFGIISEGIVMVIALAMASPMIRYPPSFFVIEIKLAVKDVGACVWLQQVDDESFFG